MLRIYSRFNEKMTIFHKNIIKETNMSTVSFISGENQFTSMDYYNQQSFSIQREETPIVICHPHDKSFSEGPKTLQAVVAVAECIQHMKSLEKNEKNDEIRQLLNQKIILETNSLEEIQGSIDSSQVNKKAKIKELSRILEGNFETYQENLEALKLEEKAYQDRMSNYPTIKNDIEKYKELEAVYLGNRLPNESQLNLKQFLADRKVTIESELDKNILSENRNKKIRKFKKILESFASSPKDKTILQTELNALREEQKKEQEFLVNIKNIVTSLENKIN